MSFLQLSVPAALLGTFGALVFNHWSGGAPTALADTNNPAAFVCAKSWHDMADDAAMHPPVAPEPDPYAPDSPDYALRTREQVMELPGGLVRVDYGASA